MPKIIDFGLAKFLGPGETTSESYGTLGYCAPEILMNQPYTSSCDIWSLGCLIYAMVTQCLPFYDENERKVARKTCHAPVKFDDCEWENYSTNCMELVMKMLVKDPKQRLTIDEVLNDSWLKK